LFLIQVKKRSNGDGRRKKGGGADEKYLLRKVNIGEKGEEKVRKKLKRELMLQLGAFLNITSGGEIPSESGF